MISPVHPVMSCRKPVSKTKGLANEVCESKRCFRWWTVEKNRQRFVIAGWTLNVDDLSGASLHRKLATEASFLLRWVRPNRQVFNGE